MSEQEVCANCGESLDKRNTNPMEVEYRDGRRAFVLMCDLCYPDFWDDCAPGVFTWLEYRDVEVCQPHWRCESCDSVYDHALMHVVIDTDYDPEREAVICGFCLKKYKEQYRPK